MSTTLAVVNAEHKKLIYTARLYLEFNISISRRQQRPVSINFA